MSVPRRPRTSSAGGRAREPERRPYNALGWALVRLGKLDEALPIAEEAQQAAREDFEVYCLYCGLMAHHGRAAEVAPLFEFLKRTSVLIQLA